MIDEDKANTLATQMMTTLNSSLDRKTALENTMVMQNFQRIMAQQGFQLNQEKLDDRRREQESKLTDEQKITLNKVVIPIVNEGIKGNTALMQVQALRDQIEGAPSGVLSGVYASSVGRLFGTDENTAMRNLESMQKGLIPMIPRLPGSSSNLDSNNLEKSIGQLTDLTLTNDQRRTLVGKIYDGFKRLTDRAEKVQTYWDANKKFDQKLLIAEPEPKPAETSAPRAGTLKWNPAKRSWE
jgi:hypothetical protein